MVPIYERELKGILKGDRDVIDKVCVKFDIDVKQAYQKIIKRPFVVVRAAGSLGVDIVAIRYDYSFPIEVKSSAERVIRMSRNENLQRQAEWLRTECTMARIYPLYAYRLKRICNEDPWRIFTIEVQNIEGRQRLVYNRIPKLAHTARGNLVIRWDDGLPLHKLIEYLCS